MRSILRMALHEFFIPGSFILAKVAGRRLNVLLEPAVAIVLDGFVEDGLQVLPFEVGEGAEGIVAFVADTYTAHIAI